jgi:probable phosphoglycerate mutase
MRVIVEADGGSRGNPGPAGYGAVVFAADGSTLAERAEGIGVATNNVAEYQGLIAGLSAARELGATEVTARMDSKLVVEQMSGRWQIKNAALKPLARTAKEIADHFDDITYTWIPRARNAHADRLANEAMDTQAGKRSERSDHVSEQPAPVDTTAPAPWTGATGTPTRFLLLRHGQTELSTEKRYSGRGDVPLTDAGLQQAKAAAARLASMEFAAVLASPLGRTRQTAAEVASAAGRTVEIHEGLVETDFGAWERLTFTEAADATRSCTGAGWGTRAWRRRAARASTPSTPGSAGPGTTWSSGTPARRSCWSAMSRRSSHCCGSGSTPARHCCSASTWTSRRCRSSSSTRTETRRSRW